MPEHKVCIVGANGQVGLEVSLFLHRWPGASVIPVCRTEYGSALLRHLGLDCRHGRLADEPSAAALMQGATIVADFGWPTNPVGKLQTIRQQIRNAIHYAPPGAPYVFVSTQCVYHLDPLGPRRTIYGLSKRDAELTALQEGRRVGRPVYVLRLGEVHGPLQRVSKGIIQDFRTDVAIVPALESHVVFTYSIAEALVNISAGRESPGIYTLVSAPGWRWPEVHAYYSRWTALGSLAVEEPVAPLHASLLRRMWSAGRSWLAAEIYRQRELLEHVSAKFAPERTFRLRLRHYRRQAAVQVGTLIAAQHWRPYGQKIEVPGQRMAHLTDVRPFIDAKNRELLQFVKEQIP